jgi:hypothetical protein
MLGTSTGSVTALLLLSLNRNFLLYQLSFLLSQLSIKEAASPNHQITE